MDLERRYLWMIHLSPLAPRCGVDISHANRNITRSWSLEGGMKALLSRCNIAPHDVIWTLDRVDPVLRRAADKAPLADIWAGPEFAELCAVLNHLRQLNWRPPALQLQMQGAA